MQWGSSPLNFREGTWERAEHVSGEKFHDLILERAGEIRITHRCMPTCVIQCSNVFADERWKKIVAQLEYEAVAMLGPNSGVSDLDKIAVLTRLCNDYGVDGIEVGCTLGVAVEAGILEFGDGERAEELIREIGGGTHLRRMLGSGAAVTGKVFGVLRVPAVKGQGTAAHEPRGIKCISVTYATSPMGADHTAAATYRATVDHSKPEGQMEVSRNIQVIMGYYDNLCCMFVSRALARKPELLINLMNAIYGTNHGPEFLTEMGKDTIKREHVFNRAAGVCQEYLPELMRFEKFDPRGLISDIT